MPYSFRLPVVFISTFPPEHCGIGNTVYDLVSASDNKRKIIVMANLSQYGESKFPNTYYAWRKGDILYPFKLFKTINKLLRTNKAIIHIEHHFFLYGGIIQNLEFPILLLLLKMKGYKIVTQFHSIIDLSENNSFLELSKIPFINNIVEILIRTFYKICIIISDHIIVTTKSMANLLVNLYGINLKKTSVIPLGWKLYSINDKNNKPNLIKKDVKIVFHGFLDSTKGIENLLDAFSKISPKLPQSTLIIAGEASPSLTNGLQYVNGLTKKSYDLGIQNQVVFTGHIKETEIEEILSSADIFVEPYTMKYSSGGSAVLSRIAGFGIPVIATRIPKFTDELVDNQTGLIVEVNDIEELANSILRLALDKKLRERLGKNLQNYAKNHTWKKSYQLLEKNVYQKLEEGFY